MGEQVWRRVAKVEEIIGSGPYAVSAGDVDVVVLRAPSGALKAYEGLCPHRGALLGEGELHGDVLVCRNHRWRFDIERVGRASDVREAFSFTMMPEGLHVRVRRAAATPATKEAHAAPAA